MKAAMIKLLLVGFVIALLTIFVLTDALPVSNKSNERIHNELSKPVVPL